MTVAFTVTLLLSGGVGICLGVPGGGGSILTVPILTYVARLDRKGAIVACLFVVDVTSAFSAIDHARKGRAKWRTGLIFGAAAMGGLRRRLARRTPPRHCARDRLHARDGRSSVAMIRGRRNKATSSGNNELSVLKIVIEGRAGGGFLVIPAVALLGGFAMPVAAGHFLGCVQCNSSMGSLRWAVARLTSVSTLRPTSWKTSKCVVPLCSVEPTSSHSAIVGNSSR